MMSDTFRFILSLSPFLVILLLAAGFRRGLIRTGIIAWCWTLAVAILAFGAGLDPFIVSQTKALILAADVLLIVWGALLFCRVCEEAGVLRSLGDGLAAAVPWKSLRALVLAWAFASFLQGAGGFGVPVVITAPLLLAAGFPAGQAVILPFIGHSWAVTFGSLGSSFQALMSASGLGADALAAPSAVMLGALCLLSGILVGWRTSERGEFPRLLPVILLAGSAMAGVQYLLAVSGFWQVASLGGGAAGVLAVSLAGWFLHRKDPGPARPPDPKFLPGLFGYLALIAVILCARWIEPVRRALDSVGWDFSLPQAVTAFGFSTPAESGIRFAPLGHPGTLLVYSSAAVYLLFRRWGFYGEAAGRRILGGTVQRAAPVSVGILLMVCVSTILSYSGMTACLAQGLSAFLGSSFAALSPWVGAAGAFLTGSNTNSNLLFAPLQQRMARSLGLPDSTLLAAQTGGGAVGSVVSPVKVGIGTAAFRADVKEGDVIRKLLLPVALLLAAASAVTILMIGF
jgi:lactate permease